jgi:crotonobetaine/carnitine-CoA ligase
MGARNTSTERKDFTCEDYLGFVKKYPTIHKLLDERTAECGAKPLLFFKDQCLTYASVRDLSKRLAMGLSELGLARNDHVGVMLRNSPEYVLSYFALSRLGAVLTAINPDLKGEALKYILANADCKCLLIDSRFLENIKDIDLKALGVKSVVIHDVEMPAKEYIVKCPEILYLKDLLKRPMLEHEAQVTTKDPVVLLYTSGTTGIPKGVLLPHGTYLNSSFWTVTLFGYREDDVQYEPLPLFHIRAGIDLIAALIAKHSIALAERFSASRCWDDVRRYGATIFNSIAAIMPILYKQPRTPEDANHNVRLFLTGPRNKEILKDFEERFKVKCIEFYGLTETAAIVHTRYDEIIRGEVPPDSAGKPVPTVELAIVDENDYVLPPNQLGEIVLRPRVPYIFFLGYYKMPEETIASWRNLWFHTGDLGYIDERGYLHFVSRVKETIRRKGENIPSALLDRIVLENEKVLEVASVPVPSELGEDEIKLCVVLKPGEEMTPEELFEWCKEKLPRSWVPRYIEFRKSLPKTATERVEKWRLRQEGLTPSTWDAVTKSYIGHAKKG